MSEALKLVEEAPSADPGESARFIGRFTLFQDQLAAAAGVVNYSVYERRLTENPPRPGYDKVPYVIYFYHVRLEPQGRLQVTHYTKVYQQAVTYPMLQGAVQNLVDNARNGGSAPAPDLTDNFANIVWTRKSYVVIFVDEESWTLHRNGDPLEGVRFNTLLGMPNHTFFDADDLTVNVQDPVTGVVTQRSAIAIVNHMKRNEAGDDLLQTEAQHFKFEIIFDVKFVDQSDAPMIVIFDPGGTNLGPPIPPPY